MCNGMSNIKFCSYCCVCGTCYSLLEVLEWLQDPEMSEQGTTGRREHVTLMIPQKLEKN